MTPTRPPGLLRLLARLLLPGSDGHWIRVELDEALVGDVESGRPRREALRRYVVNLLGSAVSLWRSRFPGGVTRGALLDVRLGLRMLSRQPVLTVVSTLALGMGIPAALGFPHYMDALISPLPVPEGDRLAGVRVWDVRRGPLRASVHEYEIWREELTALPEMGAVRSYSVNVHDGDPGQPPVRGSEISASAFDLLRVAPILGRPLVGGDEVEGAGAVVLLGEDLWKARFAADPEIIGRTIRIGRSQVEVVGVMPADFKFPDGNEVWLPLRVNPAAHPFGEGPRLDVFGRLADGATLEEANLQMARITDRLALEWPGYDQAFGQAVPLALLLVRGESTFSDSPESFPFRVITTVLLFILCGNVGLLILARTATRTAEMAIRTALGASRARIVGQVFVETLVLVSCAIGVGLLGSELLARFFTEMIANYEFMPYWVDLTLDAKAVLTGLGLGLACAVVAGLIPAIRATGHGIQPRLQRASTGGSPLRFGWGTSALVVSEVLLSVGFIALGGVLARSTFPDREGELGFQPERYLQGTIHVPERYEGVGTLGRPDPIEEAAYDPESEFGRRVAGVHRDFLHSLNEEEGVRGAAMLRHSFASGSYRPRIEFETDGGTEAPASARVYAMDVGVDFFRALGRPIRDGRDFAQSDLEQPISPAIVNESFVRDVLDGASPIGHRFHWTMYTSVREPEIKRYEVVGVVGPFGMNPQNPSEDAGFYAPIDFGTTNRMRFLVDAEDPAALIPRARALLAAVDPEATIFEPLPVAFAMRTEARVERLMSLGVLLLAGVAFFLSVSGLYAIIGFTVAQRRHEIGVRAALGAQPARIVRTIAMRSGLQLCAGLVLGIPWAWILLGELTNDPEYIDFSTPSTIAVTLVVTGVIGVLACVPPTLRGLRISPTDALRDV